jgi:hypothetical protein
VAASARPKVSLEEILHAVDGEIDALLEKGGLDLFDEDARIADGAEGRSRL